MLKENINILAIKYNAKKGGHIEAIHCSDMDQAKKLVRARVQNKLGVTWAIFYDIDGTKNKLNINK